MVTLTTAAFSHTGKHLPQFAAAAANLQQQPNPTHPRSPGEPGHVPRGPTRGLRARDGTDQQVKKV